MSTGLLLTVTVAIAGCESSLAAGQRLPEFVGGHALHAGVGQHHAAVLGRPLAVGEDALLLGVPHDYDVAVLDHLDELGGVAAGLLLELVEVLRPMAGAGP